MSRQIINVTLLVLSGLAIVATSQTDPWLEAETGGLIEVSNEQKSRLVLRIATNEKVPDEVVSLRIQVTELDENGGVRNVIASLLNQVGESDQDFDASGSARCVCTGDVTFEFAIRDDATTDRVTLRWEAEVLADFGSAPPTGAVLEVESIVQTQAEVAQLASHTTIGRPFGLSRIEITTGPDYSGSARVQAIQSSVAVIDEAGSELFELSNASAPLPTTTCGDASCTTVLLVSGSKSFAKWQIVADLGDDITVVVADVSSDSSPPLRVNREFQLTTGVPVLTWKVTVSLPDPEHALAVFPPWATVSFRPTASGVDWFPIANNDNETVDSMLRTEDGWVLTFDHSVKPARTEQRLPQNFEAIWEATVVWFHSGSERFNPAGVATIIVERIE